MTKKILGEHNFVDEILKLFRTPMKQAELLDKLSDYHENDIAEAFEELSEEERKKLYPILGAERVAEIISYIEDPDEYLKEIGIDRAAKVISYMDSDDAVDVLDEFDDSTQEKLVKLLDEDSSHDIRMILSYEDDEAGSRMTTNYIVIHNNLTVRQAMRELVKQAAAQYMENLKNAGDSFEITRDVAESLYEDYWKAEKLVETLTENVNLEVSDSEAKVITVDEIVLSDKDQADETLKKVRTEGTDFMTVAKEVSEDQEIEKKISRGMRSEEYEQAAYALASGEISDVIEADGKYYILRCVNDYDEAATKARKEEMVREKRNEVFYETYSEYAAKVHLAKDDSLWKNLSITDGERTSADFFEIFETVCKAADS